MRKLLNILLPYVEFPNFRNVPVSPVFSLFPKKTEENLEKS